MVYRSGKTYTHSSGLSCCFRQWKAKESHCSYLHGYALQVELTFEAKELDYRNWVVGFGDLKEVKGWLERNFDHKTIIAKDDPYVERFVELHDKGVLNLVILENVGMEAFAKHIYDNVKGYQSKLKLVLVREHEGNWACYSE